MPRGLQKGGRWSLVVGVSTCDFQRFNGRVYLQLVGCCDSDVFASASGVTLNMDFGLRWTQCFIGVVLEFGLLRPQSGPDR